MFFSSVALYLLVRKSSILKTPTVFNNFAMFIIPLLIYLFLAVTNSSSFSITGYEFFIIALSAFFFSYLGNVFSLKSIEYAPNPGYSLIISKSYVVFTTIAAVFAFNSELTLKSVIAILVILVSSPFIMLDKTKKNARFNKSWLLLSIGAFFCWGMLALSSKYLLNMGVSVLNRLIYLGAIVSLLILLEAGAKKTSWKRLSLMQIVVLLGIGIFSASFNYFMQVGFEFAPNIGYINVTNAASISLITLLSAFLFKDELTLRKIGGIFGVTIGLMLLFV